MTTDTRVPLRASRFRVPRSRGALSGLSVLVLGIWAGIVPFIGPYFDFAFTPSVNDAWNWTPGRGWLNVLPGAVAFVGGLLLLLSTSRLVALVGGWLGAAAGAWLVVGPVLAVPLKLGRGRPDPSASMWVQAMEQLFFYYAVGAALLFFACVALGRLSVHSIRDVRAAERRAAADTAAAEAAAAEAAERERVRREPVAEREPVTEREPVATREPVAERDVRTAPAGEPESPRHASDGTPGYAPTQPAGNGYPVAPPVAENVQEEQPHHWWSRRHRVGSAP